MVLEKIYDFSPVFIQNLMSSVKGYLIKRRRFGKGFCKELQAFENHQYKPGECLNAFFKKVQSVPAYSKVFADYPNLSGAELLSKFPIITKNDVKERYDDFINIQCSQSYIMMRTSGTTGGGLVFPYTIEMENKQWAVWWRYRRTLGIQLDTWCGWFGGKRIIDPNIKKAPYWRVNRPGRQVMFSSMHLTKDTVECYHRKIERRRLTWLHGYPSHIAKFAAFVIDKGLSPLGKVKYVTTGSENLIGNQIVLIKIVFPNAMIRQHYGLMEGVANISQNEKGEWVIDDDFAYVEFLPVEGHTEKIDNTAKIETCRIIGTSFSNPAFPLVRYDTGDIATIKRNGDGSVKVLSIDGRSSNVLKGPDGFEINEARLSIVLHDFNNIVEAQFIQHSLTNIDLAIVCNSKYGEKDEKQLRANIAECFDKRMNVNIKYVDEISRTISGKLKLIISDL